MIEVILNGEKMLTPQSIHVELKSKLELPDYYGANLDALWDCLTGWVEIPTHIIWKDVSIVEKSIPEYYIKVLNTLKEAENEGLIKLTLD